MAALEIITFIKTVGDWLWAPLEKHFGYLIHYKSNIESVTKEVEQLEAILTDNLALVDAAKMNGEEIKAQVQLWQKRANEVKMKVDRLKDEVLLNKKCLRGWCPCPDLWSCYKLSKEAVSDKETIGQVRGDGKFNEVSLKIKRPIEIENVVSIGDFVAFESTKEAMDKVMKALKDENVNTIGVYGMGGVGKTTMVKQLGIRVHKERMFSHVIIVVISQYSNINIQGQLADKLALKLEEESEEGRAGKLKERIKRLKNILIILDDIWRKIDLPAIGVPSSTDLSVCKSKILLTTRLANVCFAMGCEPKVPLNVLSEHDSWILFRRKAGKVLDSPNFQLVAHKVANECGGLPIALIVVARALGDKDLEDWEEAARQLQMSRPAHPHDEGGVFRCIKLSYDNLRGSDAKPCFLICSLFPEDSDVSIEDMVKYGMGLGLFQDAQTIEAARLSARSLVKYLKSSSLLLESEQEGCVKMHDVVRDTAIQIASSLDVGGHNFMVQAGVALKEWPRKDSYEYFTAISLMSNEIEELPDGLGCPKLLTLLLQNNSDVQGIPDSFFDWMKSLRVIDLTSVGIESLPPSLGLLTNLRTLCLDRCQSITDISILGEMKRLEILSLRESNIEELPQEIGQLVNLRMLDFTMSFNIKTIPPNMISSLSRLEELYMQGSFGEWGQKFEGTEQGTNAGFDELTCLPRLSILKVDISDAECLPKTVNIDPNWVKFDICISRVVFNRFLNVHLSKNIAAQSSSVVLDTAINTLPDWFNEVVTEKTERLLYIECRGVDNILTDQGRLSGLKFLLVQQCYPIVYLMDSTKLEDTNKPVFESLEELRVHNMDYLRQICIGELPHGSLSKLKFLEVQQCNDVVEVLLPSNLLQIVQNLEVLGVSATSVKEVFRAEGSQVVLQKLQEIKLDNQHELTRIWNGPPRLAGFQNLRVLTLIKCKKLRNLFTQNLSHCLLQLEDLWVEDCYALKEIIGTDEGETALPSQTQTEIVEKHEGEAVQMIIFPQLKNLLLHKLPHLTCFCSGSTTFECPSLEQLHLKDCPSFTTSTSYFHSCKRVQLNNEQHSRLLSKRLFELRKFS